MAGSQLLRENVGFQFLSLRQLVVDFAASFAPSTPTSAIVHAVVWHVSLLEAKRKGAQSCERMFDTGLFASASQV